MNGVHPALERGITILHRTFVEGAALEAGADRDIVIGRRLAEKLGIRLGERLVVMAPGVAGELGTAAFRGRGIFATGGHYGQHKERGGAGLGVRPQTR